MFTTGKLTKKIGIETNTMIRWQREGIVIPAPTDGRNKLFPFEEVIIGRAVAPLYLEWSIKAELIEQVAAFLREMLSVRQRLGYEDRLVFYGDILLARACTILRSSRDKGAKGETGDHQEYIRGLVDTLQNNAAERGVTFPDGWSDPDFVAPTIDDWPSASRYERFIDLMNGRDDWKLFISRDAEGEWHWATSTFDEFQADFQSNAITFIVVDLSKALAD